MEGAAGGASERTTCTPCRGTGRVISALGGEPHEVACPWCEGHGSFIAAHDAQAAPAEAAPRPDSSSASREPKSS